MLDNGQVGQSMTAIRWSSAARLMTLAAVALMLLVGQGAVARAESPRLRSDTVWQYGGAPGVVVARDAQLVVGAGARLRVLDLRDVSTPTVVSESDPLPDVVLGLTLDHGRAVVADGSGGLQIIDLTTPTQPRLVGSTPIAGYAIDVAVHGRYAYIAAAEGGLRVIDLANAAAPHEVGAFVPAAARTQRIAVAGQFVLTDEYLFDVADPAHPRPVSNWGPQFGTEQVSESTVRGVAVQGTYAYVAAGYQFAIVDVSDVTNPKKLSMIGLPGHYAGQAQAIAVAGRYAYVAHSRPAGCPGLMVVDVSDPTQPNPVGDSCLVGLGDAAAQSLALDGSRTYLAFGSLGLRTVDVTQPANPTDIGQVIPSAATHYAVDSARLYISDGAKLHVFDVTDPVHPLERGLYTAPSKINWIVASGNQAFVGANGLRSLDVTDPTAPTEVGSVDMVTTPADSVLRRDSVLFISGSDALYGFDVSDPSNPTQVGALPSDAFKRLALAPFGPYAVTEYFGHLSVIDESDPSQPPEIGSYDSALHLTDEVAFSNQHPYVYVRQGSMVDVVDLSDPANPVSLGVYSAPRAAAAALLGDDLVTVSSGPTEKPGEVRIVDVSDPGSPVDVGRASLERPADAVQVMPNGRLYVSARIAAHAAGKYTPASDNRVHVTVFDVSDPSRPTPVTVADMWRFGQIVSTGDQSYVYVLADGGMYIQRLTPAM